MGTKWGKWRDPGYCFRAGCGREVPPGRVWYCSRRCSTYQRDLRQRIRRQRGFHCPHCSRWLRV